MKKLYNYPILVLLSLLTLISCNDDDNGIGDGVDITREQNFVYFQDDSPITLNEGGGVTLIPVLINKRSSQGIPIELEVNDPLGTVGSGNFQITNPNNEVLIDANKTFGFLSVEAVDDASFQEARDITITLKALPAENIASGMYGIGIKNTITLSVTNNDSFSAIGGNYLAMSTNAFEGPSSGPIAVSIADEVVSFTPNGFDDQVARFAVSDVTFGFYEERYGIFGAGPIPGVIIHNRSDNSIEIVSDESPDPFFGDTFSGTGVYDSATGNMTLSWDDLFGDKADVSLTPQ